MLICGGLASQVSLRCMYWPSPLSCQVAPAELEEILRSHPDIEDAGVIGVSDGRAGELPRAFVVPRNPDISEEDVKKFVAAKLSEHKHLKGGVQFLTGIPKSPSGKILRRELKGLLWTWPVWPTTAAQGLSVVSCSGFCSPIMISVQFAFYKNRKALNLRYFRQ